MLKYLQTALIFDSKELQNELKLLLNDRWTEHYNKTHYDGDWSALPLRSINGSLTNVAAIHALPKGLSYQDTVLLEKCPYIKSVIASLECEKTSVRLMKLDSGAIIKEHTDTDMNMEAGEARFHIPIQTNEDVAFYIQEDRIPMLAGECWYLNLSLPHRVHNAGKEDRIHLVIDCLVNDWVKSLLNEKGIVRKEIDGMPEAFALPRRKDENEATKPLVNNAADKRKIIAELRSLNIDTATQLADSMELEAE